jgi:hypothetical protein
MTSKNTSARRTRQETVKGSLMSEDALMHA